MVKRFRLFSLMGYHTGRVAGLLGIASCLVLAAVTLPGGDGPVEPPGDPRTLALQEQRGGFDGRDADITVTRTGDIAVRRGERRRAGQMSTGDLDRLTELATRLKPYDDREDHPDDCSDCFYGGTAFYGTGGRSATEAERDEIATLLDRLVRDDAATAPVGEDIKVGNLGITEVSAALKANPTPPNLPAGFSVDTSRFNNAYAGLLHIDLFGPHYLQTISYTVTYNQYSAPYHYGWIGWQAAPPNSDSATESIVHSGEVIPTSYCRINRLGNPRGSEVECLAWRGTTIVESRIVAGNGGSVTPDDALALLRAALAHLDTLAGFST